MTNSPVAELTVESCLKELREMFPSETNICIRLTGGGHIAAHGRVEVYGESFRIFRQFDRLGAGKTLSEAMAQVRKWKEEQSK